MLVYVQQSLLAFATLGYLVLFVRLMQTTGFLRVKFFTLYVGVMVPASMLWNPRDTLNVVGWGAILILLKICVAIEVYLIVAPRLHIKERRGILLTVTGIAGLCCLVVTLGWEPKSQWLLMDWYRAFRQLSHVALSAMLLFGIVGCLCVRVPHLERWERNHALVTTLYFLIMTARTFVRPGKGEADLWNVTDSLVSAGVCLCVALWLQFVVPKKSQFQAFFNLRNPTIM